MNTKDLRKALDILKKNDSSYINEEGIRVVPIKITEELKEYVKKTKAYKKINRE